MVSASRPSCRHRVGRARWRPSSTAPARYRDRFRTHTASRHSCERRRGPSVASPHPKMSAPHPARPNRAPNAMNTVPSSKGGDVGSTLSSATPSPCWPYRSSPQHRASGSEPHVVFPPAAMFHVEVEYESGTRVGPKSPGAHGPTWPNSLLPQQYTPSLTVTHVWLAPATIMCAAPPLGRTTRCGVGSHCCEGSTPDWPCAFDPHQ
jgi:hypothetical protein